MADSKAESHGGHGGEHAHGTGTYWVIWAALLAGTLITVITGKMDFGGANIFIAMLIACVKASLVLWFFMHLKSEAGINRLVFIVSVLFLVTLLVGVFGDLMFRMTSALPNNGPIPDSLLEHVKMPSGEHE